MNNLEKLIRFLVKENDYNELTVKTGVKEETARKFTMDIFARIVPSDFNRIENSSHIDEKDLVGIVNNFNALVKEDNLKQLITNAVSKYGISVKEASDLLMTVLPVIHKNIQRIANPQKAAETRTEAKAEEKKEVDEIYDNIASRANEDNEKEEVKESGKHPKLKRKAKPAKKEKTEEEDDADDGKLSTLEKVCIYVVLGCLALLIVTFVVIQILM